ncbi:B3 domain-containing protein REM16-like [Silene latifolia]|uniref:B3 domain-containing protein REM16-like n=1 Tax=Silene latifolia TaxID=37657 RepID=UPI003D77A4E4
MERHCEECVTWAQEIYWTHFESMHFIQMLDNDFHSQLMIPRKFSENARGKLHETVTLKGPSGTATWQVSLMGCGDDLFFKGGWGDFVNAFCLEENDILIFKYKTGSCFDVLIFDRRTLCEKETSYFIRRCDHLKPASKSQEHRCLECPEDVVDEYFSEDFEAVPPKKQKIDLDNDEMNVASKNKVPFVDGVTAEVTPRKEPHFSWVPVNLPSVVSDQKQKLRKRMPETDIEKYLYGSSSVTQERMKEVLKMARKELTEDSFLLVMRATHVSRKFFLVRFSVVIAKDSLFFGFESLPAEWTGKHLKYKKQTINLRVNDKSWKTRIVFSSKGRGGLGCGWKQFAMDNCLEELDVLVFKLANQNDEPVTLDVAIFRIAQ